MKREDDLRLIWELAKKYENDTEEIISTVTKEKPEVKMDYALAIRAVDMLIESASVLRTALILKKKIPSRLNEEEILESESMAKVCRTAAAIAKATSYLYLDTLGLDDEAIIQMALEEKSRFMKVNSQKLLADYASKNEELTEVGNRLS